jgi:hypothetical protein
MAPGNTTFVKKLEIITERMRKEKEVRKQTGVKLFDPRGKRLAIRCKPKEVGGKIFQSVGVAIPATIGEISFGIFSFLACGSARNIYTPYIRL